MLLRENKIDLRSVPVYRWLQLVIVGLGVFLSSLDVTVNVALPAISRYFLAEPRVVYLMITFYLGTTVGLQMGVGSAGDHFGLRRVFFVGLFAYTIAMIAIGVSPTIEWVIGWRILQAVGNAILLAISPALATSLFPGFYAGSCLGHYDYRRDRRNDCGNCVRRLNVGSDFLALDIPREGARLYFSGSRIVDLFKRGRPKAHF